jgi:NAD(P)-dependent dehydrogenase (short-subunit alcohol dehydrogenase family)
VNLAGHRIVVTGGAQGLGLRSAELFAELGAQVFLADVQADALATAAATLSAGHATCDVTQAADVDRMFTEAVARMGGLTGVINSAGLAWVQPALELDIEGWQRVMDVNVRGTQLVCCAAARLMIPQGSGAIVNMASAAGGGGIPRRSAYGTSKAAVAYQTRCLASEWGHLGIRVNAVAPGYIYSGMTRELESSGRIDLDRIRSRIPLGKLGDATDIARAAAFLLSDYAAYITGEQLFVDGGWNAYGGAGAVETC